MRGFLRGIHSLDGGPTRLATTVSAALPKHQRPTTPHSTTAPPPYHTTSTTTPHYQHTTSTPHYHNTAISPAPVSRGLLLCFTAGDDGNAFCGRGTADAGRALVENLLPVAQCQKLTQEHCQEHCSVLLLAGWYLQQCAVACSCFLL